MYLFDRILKKNNEPVKMNYCTDCEYVHEYFKCKALTKKFSPFKISSEEFESCSVVRDSENECPLFREATPAEILVN